MAGAFITFSDCLFFFFFFLEFFFYFRVLVFLRFSPGKVEVGRDKMNYMYIQDIKWQDAAPNPSVLSQVRLIGEFLGQQRCLQTYKKGTYSELSVHMRSSFLRQWGKFLVLDELCMSWTSRGLDYAHAVRIRFTIYFFMVWPQASIKLVFVGIKIVLWS